MPQPDGNATPRAFEHECRIRDYFMRDIHQIRPNELVVAKEFSWADGGVRVDMRTVAKDQLLRDWEFKLHADYTALGQILVYVAQTRKHTAFTRDVRGVIAAFTFHPLLSQTIQIMNLGIELVTIPNWMAQAGNLPVNGLPPVPNIPNIPNMSTVGKGGTAS